MAYSGTGRIGKVDLNNRIVDKDLGLKITIFTASSENNKIDIK